MEPHVAPQPMIPTPIQIVIEYPPLLQKENQSFTFPSADQISNTIDTLDDLKRHIIFGRSEECQIALPISCTQISKKHFAILYDPLVESYMLVNYSKNGTRIMEQKNEEAGVQVIYWEPIKLSNKGVYAIYLPATTKTKTEQMDTEAGTEAAVLEKLSHPIDRAHIVVQIELA